MCTEIRKYLHALELGLRDSCNQRKNEREGEKEEEEKGKRDSRGAMIARSR